MCSSAVSKAILRADLRDFERRMTIKFTSMLMLAVGVLLAAIRFLPVAHP
ncbi:MAG TPA: hypothetical protein VGF07_02140 [Stellaceae bacterium]|jgi:hypothetical protein